MPKFLVDFWRWRKSWGLMETPYDKPRQLAPGVHMKKTTLTPAEFKSRMNALYEESCRELLRTQDFHTALESLRPVKNIITTM